MTINPIPLDDFPRTGRPWNNITPFTYRDGLTYLEVLEALRAWVRDVLTAHLNDEMEEFAENWNQVLNDFQVAVIESFDQKMEEFDVDVQAFKDAVNAQFDQLRQSLESDIANQLTTVNDALAAWDETYATFTANIQSLVDQWTTVQIENNDVITEQIISDPESATRAALNTAIAQRMPYINVIDYGAVGDGVTDDTAAIQAAMDAADASVAAGRDITVLMPFGNYLVSSGLTSMSPLDATQARIRYTGTGTAITLGKPSVVYGRRTVRLPRITCTVNTAQRGWSETPIQGVRLINFNGCEVYSQFIKRFDVGLILEGNGQGFVHTNIYPGSLWENRAQYVWRHVNNGWVNQNVSIGGRAQIMNRPDVWSSGWGIMDDPLGCAVDLEGNGNVIIGFSPEGHNADMYRVKIGGRYNQLFNVRWETQGEPIRILWKSGATINEIFGGYSAIALDEVFEDNTGRNVLRHAGAAIYYSSRAVASGTVIPAGVSKVPFTGWSVLNGRKATYDAAAGSVTPRQGKWNVRGQLQIRGRAGATGSVTFELRKNSSIIDTHRLRVPASTAEMVKLIVESTEDFNGADTFSFAVTNTDSEETVVEATGRYSQFYADYLE